MPLPLNPQLLLRKAASAEGLVWMTKIFHFFCTSHSYLALPLAQLIGPGWAADTKTPNSLPKASPPGGWGFCPNRYDEYLLSQAGFLSHYWNWK